MTGLLARSRIWTLLALAIAALAAFLGLRALLSVLAQFPAVIADAGDSWNPMLRALAFLAGASPDTLYQTLFFREQLKFQYPPSSLLPLELIGLVAPLSLPVLNAINAAILVATTLAVGALGYVAFRQPPPPADPRIMAVIAFLAAWLFYPLVYAFQLGQIQLWIDLFISLACLCWLLERRAAAGFLAACAAAIKPQFGMLLLWALVWREWGFVRGFLLLAVPVAAVSLLRYGWANHIAYLDVLSFISRHGESFYANNSVNGLVNRLLMNGPNLEWRAGEFAPFHPVVFAATAIAGAVFMLLPLVPAFLRGARRATVEDLGVAVLCFTLAAPVAWEHHYGVMLPLFVIALRFALREAPPSARGFALTVLALAWFLSSSRMPQHRFPTETVLNVVQSHLFFGALLLLAVLFAATRRPAAQRALSFR